MSDSRRAIRMVLSLSHFLEVGLALRPKIGILFIVTLKTLPNIYFMHVEQIHWTLSTYSHAFQGPH